ncbi:hypothetical protein PVIIG_05414 [Plasmodium vivax India VII]|uniref:Uncharacterized protein n=1 Tax=Plasmodium vivax India VII TaxID=1077284 RepID=A0A0J9S493_PLAVI|nr:hypothetical protein PVIIG_05414 [Plasmodium vivax India VII]
MQVAIKSKRIRFCIIYNTNRNSRKNSTYSYWNNSWSIIRFGAFIQDGERELLTDGPLRENLNSYNIGYELA